MHTSTLHTADGLPLQLRHWPLDGADSAARGSVLIVHGLGEHAGRYDHVAAHLNANAWHAVGYDLRGHGRSGGARGALEQPDSLLDDLGRVIDDVKRAHPGPLVLLGHSMGGLIAGRFVAEGLAAQPAPWWRPVDALVMSSPALDPGMNALQKGLLAVLGPLAPKLAVNNGLDPAWISRDPAVVKAYVDDPLVHDRITPRLARFIVDGGELVRQRAGDWTLPTALLYAGADRCVAPRGSDAFAAAAPRAVVHSRRYDGFSHEIFNEPEQREVLAELSRWLVPHGALNA